MDKTTWGPQQDKESQAPIGSSTAEVTQSPNSNPSVWLIPSQLPQARLLPIPVVQVVTGPAPIFPGEIGHFVGVDGSFGSLYVHDDGAEISAEIEIGQGSDREVSFTS